MQIFYLDSDPMLAAQYQCDKHVIKQILETAQLLCTAMRELGVDHEYYRSTHKYHPCTKWTMESVGNFHWLIEHGQQLCLEYTYRYEKRHKCQEVIESIKSIARFGLPIIKQQLTPIAQAMPNKYKHSCPITAYRNYYIGDKWHNINMKWTKRGMPNWIKIRLSENDKAMSNIR